jgi:hypothetical protein
MIEIDTLHFALLNRATIIILCFDFVWLPNLLVNIYGSNIGVGFIQN